MEERDEFYYPLPAWGTKVVIRAIQKVLASFVIDPIINADPEVAWKSLERQLGAEIVRYFSYEIPPLSLTKHYFVTVNRIIKDVDYSPGCVEYILEATIWRISFSPEEGVELDEENYTMCRTLHIIANSDAYSVPTYEISKAGELLETGAFDCPQCKEKIKIAKLALREVEKLRNG